MATFHFALHRAQEATLYDIRGDVDQGCLARAPDMTAGLPVSASESRSWGRRRVAGRTRVGDAAFLWYSQCSYMVSPLESSA